MALKADTVIDISRFGQSEGDIQANWPALLWVVYRGRSGGAANARESPMDAVLWGVCGLSSTGIWLE